MRTITHATLIAAGILGATVVLLSQSRPSKESLMQRRELFNGTSLDAWRGYRDDKVPAGWHIVDRTLTKDKPVADIVSKEEFGDFELELEWKISDAGNSGIFYRASAKNTVTFTGARPNTNCLTISMPPITRRV
jgi:hypothetical protein